MHLFDTNSLIKLNAYPSGNGIPFFDEIWDKIQNLLENNIVMIIKEVSNEIRDFGREEPIVEFIKRNRKYIYDYEIEAQKVISEIINKYKSMIGVFSKKNTADLFLIGCAKFFGAVIVTEEKDKKDSLKIPTIAKKENIQVLNLIEFFRNEVTNQNNFINLRCKEIKCINQVNSDPIL